MDGTNIHIYLSVKVSSYDTDRPPFFRATCPGPSHHGECWGTGWARPVVTRERCEEREMDDGWSSREREDKAARR